jgi:macrodomain Ter protein organizer (MatP/YcbG family)
MKKKFSDNAKDVKTEKASKFQNAVKQLEDLGVEPNRLKSYIKEKHPELTEEEVISIFMQQKQNG